ncbi:fucolectin-like isoform X2 [Pangasianodon hypophthalmus]|nr:fucolectin-like isoform X2 [Pangasianodon hypophthalmus]XP_053087059.1 fucolectin-like isoform X2 [Pangasianodon hypophthalmus]
METSQRPMLVFLGICIFSLQWILTHQQVNVALGRKATQSSLYGNYYYAYFATDGNRASHLLSYSCSCTNIENNPWWRVDLLAVYDISTVVVTNRGDCCPERINGAEIHIGNSLVNNGNNNPRCVVISSIPAGASAKYICNMRGRYVNIIIPNVNQFLTLCEVEVYGRPGYTFIFKSQFHINLKSNRFHNSCKTSTLLTFFVVLTKTAFLRLKFNSSEDLINPIMRDKVLQKMKSANIQSSVFQLRWTKEPELETET